MKTEQLQVVVVGGGASGMVAALAAARKGAEVTILERNVRIGKKLLATGNGRCNYTNLNADVAYYHGHHPRFVYSALASFSVAETIAFFEQLGIMHKVEEQGKVFPYSDQASSVLDVLLYELKELGIKIICDAFVQKIDVRKKPASTDQGAPKRFGLVLADGRIIEGDRVIVATGGKAMPSSGSDGNGYRLAEELGHTVTPVFPGLVQLMLEGDFFPQIQGVKLVGTASLLHAGRVIREERGDILFANYGVSGPPILQLSRQAGELLQRNEPPILKINILDRFSREELSQLLQSRFQSNPRKTVGFSLVGLINKRLIRVVLKEAGFSDLKKSAGNVSARECAAIAALLTDWRFKIRGTKGWQSAQVTAGGVSTAEVNPQTMESKIVPGLYFAGEVLDIDGECGGFNLQWAWSSGFLAGEHTAMLNNFGK
ncbi:MAG TPA: NAD(P)/FAD-dependent oxidoreductase [Peptococcaceae bacterium]|nr:NAD(P)/FAD-dependent oxidoreductase [Peptococcaceae bacterium]